jgi:F0F1-type ATP synthase delta subunit
MPDKLTMRIMDNIVKKCSQYENQSLKHKNTTISGNAHLNDNQVKSLEDIIHKRSSVKTESSAPKKVAGKMSLDDLVSSSKKR